eukprot:SAG31_NODE_2482_length_5634_cov_1.887805_6_plen_61_part_00
MQTDESAAEETRIPSVEATMSPQLRKTLATLDEEHQARRVAEKAVQAACDESAAIDAGAM